MDATGIDHVNLKIPADGVEEAIDFYRDDLGFAIHRLDEFEAGEKPFFSIRLTPESVVHLWPDDSFEAPTGTNFDHVAIRLDESLESVKSTLAAADVAVEEEFEPLGATGTAPAVYVTDPFGYRLELKVEN